MKRYLALFLVVLMMIFVGGVAYAETDENMDTRASNYFSTYGISIAKPGSSRLNITFSCSAVGTAS